MNDDQMLSEAHERGTAALSEVKNLANVIQAHEALNLERFNSLKNSDKTRYDNILLELKSIKDSQAKTNSRMWVVAGAIIMLLLGILGYMTALGVDHVMAEVIQNSSTAIATFKGDV